MGSSAFGPLWALFLVLGYRAIRRRDMRRHRAWMIRAFAVAMPAGTLIFIFAPFLLVLGEVSPTLDESIQSGAWVVHLLVAEYLIRRVASGKRAREKRETGSSEWQAGAVVDGRV